MEGLLLFAGCCGWGTSFSEALAARVELERALSVVYGLKLAETFERDGERSPEANGGSMLLATQSLGLASELGELLGHESYFVVSFSR